MSNSTEPPEIVTIDPGETTVACDGGALYGHPKVYLTVGDRSYVDCYYCGRRFLQTAVSQEAGGDPEAARVD